MSVPYAPISSDIHSCENLTNLFYLIKKFDQQFWRRGEVYGSVIFGFFSLQLAYIALQVYVQKIDFFDIGKWDPENDDTPGVQLQIAISGLAFFIVTTIVVQIMIYGAEINKIDQDMIYLYNDYKQKLLRLKNFAIENRVFIANERKVIIKTDDAVERGEVGPFEAPADVDTVVGKIEPLFDLISEKKDFLELRLEKDQLTFGLGSAISYTLIFETLLYIFALVYSIYEEVVA